MRACVSAGQSGNKQRKRERRKNGLSCIQGTVGRTLLPFIKRMVEQKSTNVMFDRGAEGEREKIDQKTFLCLIVRELSGTQCNSLLIEVLM